MDRRFNQSFSTPFGVVAIMAALVVGLLADGSAWAGESPRVSRHTYRPANAGSVAQLAAAGQNVAPTRVVNAQPLIGQSAQVTQLKTQSTPQLSASGVAGPVNAPVIHANQPAQPLVVNPVAQTTHARIVTNQYAGAKQPTVYTTYTNYGHPSSYTVQTGYTPTYTTTYTPTYTTTYRTFPVYTSSTYCAPTYYSYPRYTYYRSTYCRPSVHVGYSYGYRGHRHYRSHYSRSHIGYHGSKFSIGFSFGRGYGRCR